MKHLILLFAFCSITCAVSAQASFGWLGSGLGFEEVAELRVYPNPAIDFFQVSNNSDITQINVYNLAGRQVRTYDYSASEKYYVGDLPKGMYLIQLLGDNNRRLATRRISIR